MKKCAYCGRENEDANANCRGCGVPFEGNSPAGMDAWHTFSLFPRTAHEWTRSFAVPLFVGCVVTWYFIGGPPAIKHGFLPLLGLALALTCETDTGLHKGFRILALIVALVSVIGGMLLPELAE